MRRHKGINQSQIAALLLEERPRSSLSLARLADTNQQSETGLFDVPKGLLTT